jgi:predicted nucleotidyltransferase component of viral defense system
MAAALFRDRSDFEQTIDAAGERLQINSAIIEKDYWVSQVLRALAADFPDDFVFKGGTSLSKGYRIIHRFSEDVDILILRLGRGKGARDSLMKLMGAKAGESVGDSDPQRMDSSTGEHRTFEIQYPRKRQVGWLRPTIRLELGIRGGPEPQESIALGMLLHDALQGAELDKEYEDLGEFRISVLHPARTLVEKLALVNELAERLTNDPDFVFPAAQGRHFYDILMLLNSSMVIDFLADRDTFLEIVQDCERISSEDFASEYRRPPNGYAAGAAFTSRGAVEGKMIGAHESAREMYYGQGLYPSFSDVMAGVEKASHLL